MESVCQFIELGKKYSNRSERAVERSVFIRADAAALAKSAKSLNEYFRQGLLLEDEIEFYHFKDVAMLQDRMEKEGARGEIM